MRRQRLFAGFMTVPLLAAFHAMPLRATVIWQADPSRGTRSFGTLNLEGGSTITVVSDPTHGQVFRCYHPSGSDRCETSHLQNNLHAKEGDVWYIGWRYKLDMPQNTTTNAIFQWKAYPTNESQQNWPIVLKTISGQLTLIQRNPGSRITTLWRSPVVTNTWESVVLKINISRDITKGHLEFWYRGKQQTLLTGGNTFVCRTLDGDYTDPKWGIYGATSTVMTNFVTPPKIATTLAEADPDAASTALLPSAGPHSLLRVKAGQDHLPAFNALGEWLPVTGAGRPTGVHWRLAPKSSSPAPLVVK